MFIKFSVRSVTIEGSWIANFRVTTDICWTFCFKIIVYYSSNFRNRNSSVGLRAR